jgi:hypothetical protein
VADPPTSERPDPSRASSPAEFVSALNALRRWAGQPSLRALKTLAGSRPGSGDPPVEALPTSTTHEILAGKRLPRPPRLEFVEHFVAACLRAAHRPPGEIVPEVERWRDSWRALTGPEPGPNGNGQATNDVPVPALRRRSGRLVRLALAGALFAGGGVTGSVVTMYANDLGPWSITARSGADLCPEKPAPAADGRQLVFRGHFSEGADDPAWWAQPGRLRLMPETQQARMVVKGGTARASDIIFEQRQIPLEHGRTYTVAADLSADREVVIRLTVQMRFSPHRNVLTHDIIVEPRPCRFSYTATSDVAVEDGVVSFQLGGHDDDFTLTVDNVSLIEHPP